jgi:hypothetical protein
MASRSAKVDNDLFGVGGNESIPPAKPSGATRPGLPEIINGTHAMLAAQGHCEFHTWSAGTNSL